MRSGMKPFVALCGIAPFHENFLVFRRPFHFYFAFGGYARTSTYTFCVSLFTAHYTTVIKRNMYLHEFYAAILSSSSSESVNVISLVGVLGTFIPDGSNTFFSSTIISSGTSLLSFFSEVTLFVSDLSLDSPYLSRISSESSSARPRTSSIRNVQLSFTELLTSSQNPF